MPVKKQRKINRLPHVDYSKNGLYFITICTQKRVHFLGGIYKDIMCVNRLGSVMYKQWEWLTTQYAYIISHAFIVMPNHVHGIIEINSELLCPSVRTGHDLSLHIPMKYPKIKSLSEIIGAFKTTSSKNIHKQGIHYFSWQRSFHDRIIRDTLEYNNIYKYIYMNPILWDRDRNNILG
ncbi:MAG: hypothetical protein HOE80_03170 [Candidatus Magasanikbacteria bacterium]|nr:hypothetical protein [Candidatus Magasanikbacteria bacterium]MBT4071699.1 hypothetical protein [Candidatus Magasanikbacteria bacterium]